MSNILIPFTSGLINYLFFASILAIVLTSFSSVIIKVTRIQAPIYHHMIWQYALIGMVVFPALWLCGPIFTLEILPAVHQTNQAIRPEMDIHREVIISQKSPTKPNSPRPVTVEASVTDQAVPPRSFSMQAMLAGIWLYGTILMLLRLFAGWFRLRRICLSAESVSGKNLLESKCGGRLEILLTSHVDGPVCFGLWRPVILLPRDMYNDSSPEDLHMALNHEHAHIERRDCLTNLLQRFIEAIFFFHPFVWYASLQLTQQREQICDNYVIQKGASVMDYSKFLSRIAEQGFEKIRFQAVALFEGRLLQRVCSLLDPQRCSQIKASRRAVLAGAVAMMVCLMFGSVRLAARPTADIGSQQPNDESDSDSTNSPARKYTVVPQKEINRSRRPIGNCSISGKVISAETGEPVGHATVYLFYNETNAALFIEVAGDGTFVFKDIPTGPYSLRTTRTDGFQDTIYNPENVPGRYPRFTLTDNEQRTDVVLEVKPACSISGKVLDESGEPPKYGTLWVYAWVERDELEGGLRRYGVAGQTRIDSDGSYSLDGLDNRPIYIMAIDLRSEEKDEFYPPCYYPGTVDRNKAQMISFDDTKSAENVNFHLQRKGEFVLEGVVIDETTGKPIPQALITAHHTDMLFDHITTYTDEQGFYRIDSIGSGEFHVHVDARPFGFVRNRSRVTSDEDAKVNHSDFALKLGITIRGTFVDEQGDAIEISPRAYGIANNSDCLIPPGRSWTGTRNRQGAKERTADSFFQEGEGDYESESMDFPTPGSFIIEGLMPGTTVLRFYPKAKGQTVKEILYRGTNITETGIETKPGQEIQDVTIVIEKGTSNEQ